MSDEIIAIIMKSIILFSLVGGVVALIFWWLAMMLLRQFRSRERRFPLRSEEKRSDESKYHNEAIYRDFDYFFKATLAILGGIAFVATRETNTSAEIRTLLLSLAGVLQTVVAIIFSLFIFFHQKSKIERWDDYFSWREPFSWQECWMVVSMFAVSAGIGFGAIPALLTAL